MSMPFLAGLSRLVERWAAISWVFRAMLEVDERFEQDAADGDLVLRVPYTFGKRGKPKVTAERHHRGPRA